MVRAGVVLALHGDGNGETEVTISNNPTVTN
jgi:hypothetical protein